MELKKKIMKIKISKEQQKLLHTGIMVTTNENVIYRYLPFWYKETEDEDLFEEIQLGKLPEDLVKVIKIERERLLIPPKNNSQS